MLSSDYVLRIQCRSGARYDRVVRVITTNCFYSRLARCSISDGGPYCVSYDDYDALSRPLDNVYIHNHCL